MPEKKPQILLIDDDADSLDVMSTALRLKGFTVKTARDREGALKLHEAQTFDAIVVDFLMQGMDAYSFMREVWKRKPLTPTLFISGSKEGSAAAKRLGVPFLKKPFGPEELCEAVEKCISKRMGS